MESFSPMNLLVTMMMNEITQRTKKIYMSIVHDLPLFTTVFISFVLLMQPFTCLVVMPKAMLVIETIHTILFIIISELILLFGLFYLVRYCVSILNKDNDILTDSDIKTISESNRRNIDNDLDSESDNAFHTDDNSLTDNESDNENTTVTLNNEVSNIEDSKQDIE